MFSNIRCGEGKLNEAVERMENCQGGKWSFQSKWKKDATHIWKAWIDRRQFTRAIRKEGQAREDVVGEARGNQLLMLLFFQLEVLRTS